MPGSVRGAWRNAALPFLLLFLGLGAPGPLSGQEGSRRVDYLAPRGDVALTATLDAPPGDGPHPGLVLLTLAGVEDLRARLVAEGWAVLVPELRGMGGAPELQLRASFGDLAGDVSAALAWLRSQPAVDGGRVGLVAQGGETPVATLAAVASPEPAFLVLLSARGLPGDSIFRVTQRRGAARRGLTPDEAFELDRIVDRLATVIRTSRDPFQAARRVRVVLAAAPVLPHQPSSFPSSREGQVRFFSSRWWKDHFTFAPDTVLARVAVPTLVVQGLDGGAAPVDENHGAVARALAAAPSPEVTLCRVEGSVEHGLPEPVVEAMAGWLARRGGPDPAGGASEPVCP